MPNNNNNQIRNKNVNNNNQIANKLATISNTLNQLKLAKTQRFPMNNQRINTINSMRNNLRSRRPINNQSRNNYQFKPNNRFNNVTTGTKTSVNNVFNTKTTPSAKVSPLMKPELGSMLAYAKCRINPLAPGPNEAVGIPDGDSTRKIVVDYRTYADINCTGVTSLSILTTPTLGFNTSIKTASAGVTMTNSLGSSAALDTYGGTNILDNYTPLTISPEWATYMTTSAGWPTAGKPALMATPFSGGSGVNGTVGATRMRLVSCVTRIMYTGAVMNCSGTLSATSTPLGCAHTFVNNPQAINYYTYNGTLNTIPANDTISDVISGTVPSGTYYPDTVTTKMEEGITIALKHSGGKYIWRPIAVAPSVLTLDTLGNTSYPQSLIATCDYGGTQYTNIGFASYDFDWEANVITITGLQANTSIRVENYVCFEIALGVDSPFYRLAKELSVGNQVIVDKIAEVAKNVPTAVKASEDFNPWYVQAARIVGLMVKTGVKAAIL